MKLLVIGCGSIGRRHAENASQYAKVGIYDQDFGSAFEHAAQINGRAFKALPDAFSWGADGVIVATPHNFHLMYAEKALFSGAHVLIEKPISDRLDHVGSLLACGKEQRKKIYVVCNMRFHSAITVLKSNLEKIGRPLFARAHYGNYLPNMRPGRDYRSLYAAKRMSGGGVVLDAIHEVDYMRWLFGEIDSVLADAGKLSNLAIDVEDYATLILRHRNGVRSEIHLDYLQQCKRRGCEIIGEEGTLLWESKGKSPEVCEVTLFLKNEKRWETLYRSENEDHNRPYQKLIEQFTGAINNEVNELAQGEDGLQTLRVSLAALESVQREGRVFLPCYSDRP